jgi:MSHA biogenesis protein MshN
VSLINKMLQDLDKRNAIQDSPDGEDLRRKVRAVGTTGIGSEWFWRVLAGLIFIALCWVGWVIWQVMPHPVVNELALRSGPPPGARPSAPVSAPPAAPAPAESATAASPPEAAPAAPAGEKLKLAMELTSPVPRPRAAPAQQTAQPAAKPGVGAPAPSGAKIDKRETGTSREHAEAEFRRGLAYVNQGRVAEGMDALRTALAHDQTHEGARQTMVALLLESRRLEDAARLLKDGLAINPANAQFALLLARVTVERGDAAGALAILDGPGQSGSPDHRAFRGALLQRLGRHKEAVEEYRGSLGASPGMAQWWVGLGISQQALAQPKDALESFRRARGAGNLTPELTAFVDQRIRQLQ